MSGKSYWRELAFSLLIIGVLSFVVGGLLIAVGGLTMFRSGIVLDGWSRDPAAHEWASVTKVIGEFRFGEGRFWIGMCFFGVGIGFVLLYDLVAHISSSVTSLKKIPTSLVLGFMGAILGLVWFDMWTNATYRGASSYAGPLRMEGVVNSYSPEGLRAASGAMPFAVSDFRGSIALVDVDGEGRLVLRLPGGHEFAADPDGVFRMPHGAEILIEPIGGAVTAHLPGTGRMAAIGRIRRPSDKDIVMGRFTSMGNPGARASYRDKAVEDMFARIASR